MGLGKRVPEDLSIIGFDDLPFAAHLSPALTTIRVDAVAQGMRAAELLIKILKGAPIESRQLRMETELVVRASCARANQWT
jgi:DNA-binding LacI/PurR family transcriptional regulator